MKVLLGVTGSVAAFKAAEIARELGRQGATVRTILTSGARNFIGPETFRALTGQPAYLSMWEGESLDGSGGGELHVELADWADRILVAPATAHFMAQLASGLCPDLLSTTILCGGCPVYLAPAMHTRMWEQASTQRNLRQLQGDSVHFLGPEAGELANGEQGLGRMMAPTEVVKHFLSETPELEYDTREPNLQGKRVLITAGPTYEDIDPVRFIGNRSSGRMGVALAQEALARGATVELILGPATVAPPPGCQVARVRSAKEMQTAVKDRWQKADIVIMAAAVADYRPEQVSTSKHKKQDKLDLKLVKNPDILAEIGAVRKGRKPVLVGFALETEDLATRSKNKLEAKGADLIVGNSQKTLDSPVTEGLIVSRKASPTRIEATTKRQMAALILGEAEGLLSLGPPSES